MAWRVGAGGWITLCELIGHELSARRERGGAARERRLESGGARAEARRESGGAAREVGTRGRGFRLIGSEAGGVEGAEGGRRGRRIEVGSRLSRGRVDFFGLAELESSQFGFFEEIGNLQELRLHS